MGRLTQRRRVLRLTAGDEGITAQTRPDLLAVEEPLEIRVDGESVVLTMRLPGHDVELAHGFLHSEGFLTSREDVVTAQYCAGSVTGDEGEQTNTYNLLDVTLRRVAGTSSALGAPVQGRRHAFLANSACGVCGTASLDELAREARFDVSLDPVAVPADLLLTLPDRLAERQSTNTSTGTLHAAGLFTPEGRLLLAREDVGRHNAVDKLVGWALMNDRLPLTGVVLVVTSRASFEIVQKAQLAGIAVVATVSGATSLAVDAADAAGITLAGFVRPGRATVYTRADRIVT